MICGIIIARGCMWLQFLALVQHVSSKAARETTRFPGPLHSCVTQTGAKKNVISLVIKEAVNITKEETAIRQKKSGLHRTSFTKRSVHFQAEQKHSVNANKGEVPAQALQKSPFRVKEKSSALEMKDIPALRWKGDNPQLFLSALLSCSDLLSNQIIRFAATSANTYSMKSLGHKR